jgi:hypothetical protein
MIHDGKEVSPTGFDAVRVFNEKGTDRFAIGVDVNDGYKFKVSLGGALGANGFVTVTPAGNFGFGTTGPTYEAQVYRAAANARLGLTSGTGFNAVINLGDIDDENIGQIVYDNAQNQLQFRTNNGGYDLSLSNAGYVGVKELFPTEALDIDADAIRLRQPQTPATAGAVGTTGMICWSTGHIYVCVGSNEWERAALSSW